MREGTKLGLTARKPRSHKRASRAEAMAVTNKCPLMSQAGQEVPISVNVWHDDSRDENPLVPKKSKKGNIGFTTEAQRTQS